MSFENLKRNRDQISKLVQAAEAVGGSGESKYQPDERIWKPTVDKAGNGYAVIRFLPASEGAELPWVRYWDHGFKGPTGISKTALLLLVNLIQLANSTRDSGTQVSSQTKTKLELKNVDSTM